MLNRQLNWLSITTGSLLATLLFVTGTQAAELASSTSHPVNSTLIANHTLSHRSHELISLRKKKKRSKQKVKRRAKVTATAAPNPTSPTVTSPTDVTQTPPPPAPVTPPPAPAEPSVTREEVEALRKSNQELREQINTIDGRATETDKKIEQIDKQQFSTTTKLQGSVIFGATGGISGDYSNNVAFGQRTRLELVSDIGGGTLTARLQAGGMGSANQNPKFGTTAVATPEGGLFWTDGVATNSTVSIDALKYQFLLSPQTLVTVIANAGAADDFTDTINPYFDGDGNSGAISAFASRPSIYYTIQGAGVGLRHKLNDSIEVSLGYLARQANNPGLGFGLFNGGYGALAQVAFKTGENSKLALTYTNSYNSDFGTGSNNANPDSGGIDSTSNNFGVQGSFQVSPQLALGGWAGYTQNQTAGGDRQIWNWAITAAAPDLGGKGNLAGFLIGQEPRVTSSGIDPLTGVNTTDTKAGLHIEGFYQFKVSDSISITPGIIYLTAPNQDANSTGAVIGALRTTFTF